MVAEQSEDILKDVVAEFRRLRLELGLSHEEVAKRAELSRSHISHIESGKRRPTLQVCLQVAGALNVPLSTLLSKAEVRYHQVEEVDPSQPIKTLLPKPGRAAAVRSKPENKGPGR